MKDKKTNTQEKYAFLKELKNYSGENSFLSQAKMWNLNKAIHGILKRNDNYPKAFIVDLANNLMSYKNYIKTEGEFGKSYGEMALKGAKLYEFVGMGNRISVKRRLFEALEKDSSPKDINQAIEFYKRNSKYIDQAKGLYKKKLKQKKEKGLERIITIISSGFLLSSIFFLSSTFTGNVIGNLTKTNSNLIGVILFILGIIGLFAFTKNK